MPLIATAAAYGHGEIPAVAASLVRLRSANSSSSRYESPRGTMT